MIIRNALFAALLAASCGPLPAQTPAEGRSPPPAPSSPTSEDSKQAPAPAQRVQRGSDEWCARSFCGCWEPVTLRYSARIVEADGAPVEGVSAVCHGETEPVAMSAGGGVLQFEIETQTSPGCGYQRCRIMTLTDPQGRFADKEIVAGPTNGGEVVVERR